VPMSPKGRWHEVLKENLQHLWAPRAPMDVRVSLEQQLNLDVSTYTEPDAIVHAAAIRAYDVRGDTALLVIEVADSSWDRDTVTKARVYASFGVRDYWVINARDKSTRIHRSPAGESYADVRDVPATGLLTPLLVPQLAVRLADLDLV